MGNILKVVFVIIGAIIGAGFASGQEISLFFNRYGEIGILGVITSCIAMGLIIYKVLKIMVEKNINTYEEFSEKIFKVNNKFVQNVIKNIINIFLLISFYIMVAGFGAYFKQELNTTTFVGAITIAMLCYITFNKNIQGIIKVNEILMPVLVILIIILGIQTINYDNFNLAPIGNYVQQNTFAPNWFISSIIYASYNSVVLIPILLTLHDYVKTKKDGMLISILSTIILMILAIIIYFVLNTIDVGNAEIPIVYIASKLGIFSKYIYGFVILVAIFTSAISAGYSFLKNVTKTRKTYIKLAGILCFMSIFIAEIGFSVLVNLLYPIFGYLGIIQIFLILLEKNKYN